MKYNNKSTFKLIWLTEKLMFNTTGMLGDQTTTSNLKNGTNNRKHLYYTTTCNKSDNKLLYTTTLNMLRQTCLSCCSSSTQTYFKDQKKHLLCENLVCCMFLLRSMLKMTKTSTTMSLVIMVMSVVEDCQIGSQARLFVCIEILNHFYNSCLH